MSKGDDEDDYEVGYGKPPKEHQFKPGQSGNSNGRPKRAKNLRTTAKDVFNQPIRITEDGNARTVSAFEAALMAQRNKAIQGDTKAFIGIKDLAFRLGLFDAEDEAPKQLNEDDSAIVLGTLERLFETSSADGDADAQPEPDRPANAKTAKAKKSKGDET